MLYVYTSWKDAESDFLKQYPDALNWCDSSVDEIITQAETVISHHSDCAVFLGYLEGWMLSIPQEIRLRPLLRKFPVCVLSRWPMSLPLAWKNELDLLHVNPSQQYGDATSYNDGRIGQDTLHHEHGHSPSQPTDPVSAPEGGKAGNSAPRRKRKGPNQAPRQTRGTTEEHGVRV